MGFEERDDKCREIFSLLSEYLNLELPPDACREMESHIAGCAPCVEFTESLRKTVELCHRYQASEVPEPLSRNAREELESAFQRMLAARKGDAS